MLALVLCLAAVALLCVALTYFSRSSGTSDSTPPQSLRATPFYRDTTDAYGHLPALTEAIFSRRDLEFIRREASPELEKLFLAERKAVAAYWLTVPTSRISEIRKNHLTNSR